MPASLSHAHCYVYILLRVLPAPDLPQELLNHLHISDCRLKFQREQEPITPGAEPELLIHQGQSGLIRAVGHGKCHRHTRTP